MIELAFEVTQTRGFPISLDGGAVGMTMCRLEGHPPNPDPRKGDPALAFTAQSQWGDDFVCISPNLHDTHAEWHRGALPQPDFRVGGMCYNPFTKDIWYVQNTQGWTTPHDRWTEHIAVAFDPHDGSITREFEFARSSEFADCESLATNGLMLAASFGDAIEFRTMSGALIRRRTYEGRAIAGLSAGPWSWVFADRMAHELVVTNLAGAVIATAPAPGPEAPFPNPGQGPSALAYDYVNYPHRISKDYDDVSTDTRRPPDWPWSPPAWVEAHRIYVANATNGTIYAGYLTPA